MRCHCRVYPGNPERLLDHRDKPGDDGRANAAMGVNGAVIRLGDEREVGGGDDVGHLSVHFPTVCPGGTAGTRPTLPPGGRTGDVVRRTRGISSLWRSAAHKRYARPPRVGRVPHLFDQTPRAGMPVRSTLRGEVSSFHVESALFTGFFASRFTNWPWPSFGFNSPSSTATRPRVSV